MRIRPATAADLPLLGDIERAAGECFRTVDMPEIAEDEPLALDRLDAYRRSGLAWVAADAADRPIAYLIAEPVDGALHIEQVSVHPDWAHRRIGRTLIEAAAQAAAERGLESLTLTTFTEVPWNAPYYTRCGFTPIPDDRLTPGLQHLRAEEAAHGLDRWPRTAMTRRLHQTPPANAS